MREIPAIEWPEFLAQFNREHRAWLATIERARPGTPRATEAVECPLESVTPELRARRVVGIDIRFLDDARAREAIRVDAPASLRVDETAEGTVRGVEIQDERGECVRIQFRAAPLPEALDGIAPGELPT